MTRTSNQSPDGQPALLAAPKVRRLRERLTHTTLSLAPILVGFTLLCTAIALTGCGVESATPIDSVRPVKTTVVALGNQAQTASYPGTIQPRRESQLGFRVGGKVAKRYVQLGDQVAPGTALATLEQDDLKLRLKAAEAQMRAAAADAEQARLDLQRYEQIKTSPAFSQAVYDRRLNTRDGAIARLKDAESQMKLAQNRLDYTTLVADDFGVVTAANIEPGQVVAEGQTAIVIARSADLDVAVSIPETRLADLARAEARVAVWSQPGESIPARVREVAASADPTTRTYAVRFALDELPADLQLGMSATVTLAAAGNAAVAEIPLSAVFEHQGQSSVWTVTPAGQLNLVPVTITGFGSVTALVGDGLKQGDIVVTAGVHKLDLGQKVKPLAANAS
jgi:RND family efflux transporter MFP subunit